MLIALLATLSIAAVWFVALRPKPEEAAPPAVTPAQVENGITSAPGKAEKAVEQSNSSSAATEQAAKATDEAAPTATTGAPTDEPAATPKPKSTSPSSDAAAPTAASDPSKPMLAELAKGRTVVLLFWDAKSSDGRAVRNELAGINRHGGKVSVHASKISSVGKYLAITGGVRVELSPTLLVIGPNRKARTIVGFTVRREIDGLVNAVVSANRR